MKLRDELGNEVLVPKIYRKKVKQMIEANDSEGISLLVRQFGGGAVDAVNKTSYTPGTETYNNPYNIIPGGDITMEKTPFPVMGFPLDANKNVGEPRLMAPGTNHQFPGAAGVLEVPVHKTGGYIPSYQKGTPPQNKGPMDPRFRAHLDSILQGKQIPKGVPYFPGRDSLEYIKPINIITPERMDSIRNGTYKPWKDATPVKKQFGDGLTIEDIIAQSQQPEEAALPPGATSWIDAQRSMPLEVTDPSVIAPSNYEIPESSIWGPTSTFDSPERTAPPSMEFDLDQYLQKYYDYLDRADTANDQNYPASLEDYKKLTGDLRGYAAAQAGASALGTLGQNPYTKAAYLDQGFAGAQRQAARMPQYLLDTQRAEAESQLSRVANNLISQGAKPADIASMMAPYYADMQRTQNQLALTRFTANQEADKDYYSFLTELRGKNTIEDVENRNKIIAAQNQQIKQLGNTSVDYFKNMSQLRAYDTELQRQAAKEYNDNLYKTALMRLGVMGPELEYRMKAKEIEQKDKYTTEMLNFLKKNPDAKANITLGEDGATAEVGAPGWTPPAGLKPPDAFVIPPIGPYEYQPGFRPSWTNPPPTDSGRGVGSPGPTGVPSPTPDDSPWATRVPPPSPLTPGGSPWATPTPPNLSPLTPGSRRPININPLQGVPVSPTPLIKGKSEAKPKVSSADARTPSGTKELNERTEKVKGYLRNLNSDQKEFLLSENSAKFMRNKTPIYYRGRLLWDPENPKHSDYLLILSQLKQEKSSTKNKKK